MPTTCSPRSQQLPTISLPRNPPQPVTNIRNAHSLLLRVLNPSLGIGVTYPLVCSKSCRTDFQHAPRIRTISPHFQSVQHSLNPQYQPIHAANHLCRQANRKHHDELHQRYRVPPGKAVSPSFDPDRMSGPVQVQGRGPGLYCRDERQDSRVTVSDVCGAKAIAVDRSAGS